MVRLIGGERVGRCFGRSSRRPGGVASWSSCFCGFGEGVSGDDEVRNEGWPAVCVVSGGRRLSRCGLCECASGYAGGFGAV